MSTSNIFSNVYIYGNCTVKGTLTTLGGSAVSQWTTAGSTIYYSTGNVGIGTATPAYALDVWGGQVRVVSNPLLLQDVSASPSIMRITPGGDGKNYIQSGTALTSGSSADLIFGTIFNASQFLTIKATSGFVGIGTTNPGSLLTVSGGVAVGSGYQTTLAPTNGLVVQGNVGIGTSNPGVNALQVTGNVVTQGFTSNSTNTVFNFDTLTIPFVNATQVGVGTTVPDNTIDAVGSIVIAPVTFAGASNYGIFFRRGFSTSNFYNCSILAYDHNADTNPDGISINGWDGVSICTGANTRQERMRVTATGNVGIGTSNPGLRLSVNGSVNIGAAYYIYPSYNSKTGPYMVQASGYDAVGTTHTIPFVTFGPGNNASADNFSGLLIVTGKSVTTTGKSGVVATYITKSYGINTSATNVAAPKVTGITTFAISISGNDVIVTTDSDVAVTWVFFGGS